MGDWTLWLAAAPIAATIILLTPLWGRVRLRARLPWIGAVALLLFGSTMSTQCTARSVAIADVEARLFPSQQDAIAVYDVRTRQWLQIAAGPLSAPPSEVRLLAPAAPSLTLAPRGPGRASALSERPYNIQLKGSSDDVALLERALEMLVATRAGQAAVGDVLLRDDVTISLSDEIGLELPNGHLLTTGGTAVTEGKKITLSRRAYGFKGPEVLAAMVGHELTHVAQNLAAGTAWWQWPWTTVDRESTAHVVQAVVWAELRGYKRDWEQDRNLDNALSREALRYYIQSNPAYPWWLAPDLSC
jgi:hypothetical protein